MPRTADVWNEVRRSRGGVRIIRLMYPGLNFEWLIPVLLIPKPMNPALLQNHMMFMVLYLTGFFLERKPCTICSIVFLAAVFLICYSGMGSCIFSPLTSCSTEQCDLTFDCVHGGCIWKLGDNIY